jgi:hypothetical protein
MDASWIPRTREQREAVELLANRCEGVLVRSLPDGAAEVLAVQRGVYNRYLVHENGWSEIVESQPRDWRWPRNWRWPLSDPLGWGFGVFGLATPFLLVILHSAGLVDGGWWGAIAFFGFFGGLILLVAAWWMDPSPYRLMHPGEHRREWDRVGWPEH